tara:strand:+ start:447 stop:1085 length:639 start_codon:yes stop_codon:yes gene_type:complete
MGNNNSFRKTENVGSIWITGLSSAGKTTLAKLLERKLWENGYPSLLLDGNQIRHIFQERLGYDADSRRKQTKRVLRIAQWVSSNGIIPVVAIIHPFEDDRIMCRQALENYYEVHLKCDLDVCIKRDNKGVYAPVSEGKAANVVGLDITYDIPKCSDIVLESDKLSPEQILERLLVDLKKKILPELNNNTKSDISHFAVIGEKRTDPGLEANK